MVRARHEEIQKIERDFVELAQMFQDLDALVVQQEAAVTQIDESGEEVLTNVNKANEEISGAIEKARSRNRKKWWCLLICRKHPDLCNERALRANYIINSSHHHHYRGCRRRRCRCDQEVVVLVLSPCLPHILGFLCFTACLEMVPFKSMENCVFGRSLVFNAIPSGTFDFQTLLSFPDPLIPSPSPFIPVQRPLQ